MSYLYRGTESWVFGEEIDGHKFGFSHDFFGTCPSNGTSAWTVEVSNNEGNSTSLFPEEVTFTLVEDPRDQLWSKIILYSQHGMLCEFYCVMC